MTDANAHKQTIEQVIKDHPKTVRKTLNADLADVAKWLKCKPGDLALRKADVSADTFRERVDGLIESYSDFPEERKRMLEILKKIGEGEPLLPIFIEENDPDCFIMEGRHRIVDFLIAGLTTIPVLFASELKRPLDLNPPTP